MAASLTLGVSAFAQDNEDVEDVEGRLKSVQSDIEQAESQKKQYEQDVAALSRQQRELQKRLVEAAAQARGHEEQIEVLGGRLVELRAKEAVAAAELETKSAELAVSLAAMQRLSRQPPATLILRPASIDDKARTAILLDSVMPALADQADALREQVSVVQALRQSIEEEQTALFKAQDDLEEERHRIDKLLAEKAAKQKELAAAIKREQARLVELAKEADSLEALLKKLEDSEPESGAVREEFSQVGRPIDGLPFSEARGTLPLPVPGVVVGLFNKPDDQGNLSKGIQVETRPDSTVISPWDGKVIFAGPFRDYGQLLIISHGEGYHTLLAGMGRLDVVVAQWILAGEPIGQMSGNRSDVAQSAAPRLYIELRRNGRSINPLPWIAAGERKVRG